MHLFTSVLLSVFFTISSAWSAEFYSVPKDCESLLNAAKVVGNSKSNQDALKSVVDWSAIQEHMLSLGYPSRIVEEKLKQIEWYDADALQLIRDSLKQKNWQWGATLSETDSRRIGKQLSYYHNHTDSLSALPFWNSLRGFNAPAAINAYLRNGASSRLGDQEQKVLAQYAPLWLRGPLALENAQLYFKGTDRQDAKIEMRWLLENLPERARTTMVADLKERLERDYKGFPRSPSLQAESALTILSTLPWANLPSKIREDFEVNWIDLKKFPPIVLDNIRHIARGFESAGDCPYMANGHIRSLGLQDCDISGGKNEDLGEAILIRVNGNLVGSLKQTGDPSMIALRNVFDNEGRLVLAIGGVYHLDQDTAENVMKKFKKSKDWIYADLESLQVHPHTFLLNSDSWDNMNLPLLLTLAKKSVSKDEMLKVIFDMSDDYSGSSSKNLHETLHQNVWFKLLEELNRVRRNLE